MVDAWLKFAAFLRRVSPDPADEEHALREAARLEESERRFRSRRKRRPPPK